MDIGISSSYLPPKSYYVPPSRSDSRSPFFIEKEKGKDKREGLSLSSLGKEQKREEGNKKGILGKKLSPQQEQKVEELKRIDRHVRAHEQAHVAAGGPYVIGGPVYSYVIGPDGNRYAVAGEVKIDMSPVPGDPDATIQKEETVRRAALAPSDPSPQDLAVAARAEQLEMEAELEKMREEVERLQKDTGASQGKGIPPMSSGSSIESLKREKVFSYYNAFSASSSDLSSSFHLMV